jgi:two-component system NtrC family sensor kinase
MRRGIVKLFYQLFGYLLIGIVVLIGSVEYLTFRAEVMQFEEDMIANGIHNGRSLAGILAYAWRTSGEEAALRLLSNSVDGYTVRVRWVWLDELLKKRIFPEEQTVLLGKVQNNEIVSLIRFDTSKVRHLYTYVPTDVGAERHGAIELKQILTPLGSFRQKMIHRAIWISVMLAVLSGTVLFYFIDTKIRNPLGRLIERTKRIGQGDLSTDPVITSNDELAVMAQTLNDLCASLSIAKEKIKFEYEARLKTLEQLRHTERLSTFGLISAGIAHEIGTPLNVVDGRAKMILKDELNPKEIKECAAIIQGQAERMTVIIRQLLDFTRRPKQQIAEENMLFIVKQIFQLLHPMASRQHVTFSLHKEPRTEVTISVDGGQMQQVLINLLMNSVQAMPSGGNVSVNISNEMRASASVANGETEKHMKISIVDEGSGISQEDVEKIFTPFFTTKTIGTGLGLSIAHGIVEEHGGWIEVADKVPNGGACFSVFLPMTRRGQ